MMKDRPTNSSDAAQTQVARVCGLAEAMWHFHEGYVRSAYQTSWKILRKWMRASDARLAHASSMNCLVPEWD